MDLPFDLTTLKEVFILFFFHIINGSLSIYFNLFHKWIVLQELIVLCSDKNITEFYCQSYHCKYFNNFHNLLCVLVGEVRYRHGTQENMDNY